jgi:hypothetical protein
MSYFCQLPFKVVVPEFDPSNWRMAQVADVPDRSRYKYTLWEKEIAPPTPLHVFSIPEPFASELLNQLPKKLLEREIPGVYYMKMEKPHPASTVPPHVDIGRRTAINIYIDCAGEVTEFFEADEQNQSLTSMGSFTACAGDAWLLNVSKPHAVRMGAADLRSCISFSFRHSRYAELAQWGVLTAGA